MKLDGKKIPKKYIDCFNYYIEVIIKKKDEEIKCYKDLCEAYKKQSHNFLDNELKVKANQNQKAIECLKEIRKKAFGTDEVGIVFDIPPVQDVFDLIDNKIKELEKNND